jgi:hypothetical protein
MPIPKVASIPFVIDAIHNGIELVKFAFSLPPSEPLPLSPSVFPHSLPTSAPEVLCLILDSLSDTTLISSAEVARLLAHLSDILVLPLSSATAQRISEWSNHLTFAALHAPEDIFGALHLDNGEVITMHSLPLVPQSLPTPVEPVQNRATSSSDGHEFTCSMLLRYLVGSGGRSLLSISWILTCYFSLSLFLYDFRSTTPQLWGAGTHPPL